MARADTATKLQHRLDIAGNPPAWDIIASWASRCSGSGVFGVLGFLYLLGFGWPFYRVVVATGLMAGFGYVLPNILLSNAGQKREKLMRNSLPTRSTC